MVEQREPRDRITMNRDINFERRVYQKALMLWAEQAEVALRQLTRTAPSHIGFEAALVDAEQVLRARPKQRVGKRRRA